MITATQELSTLFATEAFLLSAIGLCLALAERPKSNRKRLTLVAPAAMAIWIAIVMSIIAVGALTAWVRIYTGGSFGGWLAGVTAGCILIALVVLPFLGWSIALGLRVKKPNAR